MCTVKFFLKIHSKFVIYHMTTLINFFHILSNFWYSNMLDPNQSKYVENYCKWKYFKNYFLIKIKFNMWLFQKNLCYRANKIKFKKLLNYWSMKKIFPWLKVLGIRYLWLNIWFLTLCYCSVLLSWLAWKFLENTYESPCKYL